METVQQLTCNSGETQQESVGKKRKKKKKKKKGKILEVGNDGNADAEKEDGELSKNELSKHPYSEELSKFQPNQWQLEQRKPQLYYPVDETKLTMVDSQQSLNEMMCKLKMVKEIVIDLEHHSYRSYKGIVCLVQISTRVEDFIVDALVLKEQLNVLNDICTDPTVLKVFHGSDQDICWLQRDFGVYVVNMFDTQQAARMLNEERTSLAHLLNKYCNVDVNKRFGKMVDWRIRPLGKDMINYAREDTHYLLYIYDMLRNITLQRKGGKALLKEIYSKSTSLCMLVHEEKVLQPGKPGKLNAQQQECFRLLFHWRDEIARQQDESTGYTLPNKMMFHIAQTLPSDPQDVISCCFPLPPLVHQHCEHIHKLIVQAIANVPYVPKEDEEEKEKQPGESKKKKKKKKQSEKKGETSIEGEKEVADEIISTPNEQKRQYTEKSPKNTKRHQGNGDRGCFECGKPGHWARDCRMQRDLIANTTEPSMSPLGHVSTPGQQFQSIGQHFPTLPSAYTRTSHS